MLIQYLLAIVVMANAFGALSVIGLFWRRGALASRPTLVALSGAAFLYAFGYALELATVDLSMKLYSLALAYLGVVALPPLLIRAVASHLDRVWLNRASIQIVAWSLSLCMYVLFVTTAWTGFFFVDLRLIENGPLIMLNLEPGPGFYAQQVYVAAAVLLVNVEILRELVRRPPDQRRRLLALMIASMMPWAANLAYVLGLVPWGLDAPPFLIVVVVGLLVWSLRNEVFGELRPQARDEVVERLSDPVIVTDQNDRIIDMNPAGRDLLSHLSHEPGADRTHIFDYPALSGVRERSIVASSFFTSNPKSTARTDAGPPPKRWSAGTTPIAVSSLPTGSSASQSGTG